MLTHEERLQAAREKFTQVNATLADEVEALDAATATRNPAPDSWNAAQIALHVAITTEFLSGAMSGGIPEVLKPRPADFQETLATMDMSGKMKTFSMLEPGETDPATALQRLRASEEVYFGALESVTEERAAAECVQLPFGLFSLYEIAEFTHVHVVRHTGQMRSAVAA